MKNLLERLRVPLGDEEGPLGDGFTPPLRSAVRLFIGGAGLAVVLLYFLFPNAVIDYRVDQTGDAIAYLYLTRSLADSGTYPSLHWSPGLPLLFAPLVRFVGIDMTAIKLGMVVFGLGTAAAVFVWSRRIVGTLPAGLVALSVASSPVFFDYSHRFLSEIPFAFFIIVFFLLIQRGVLLRGRVGPIEYAGLAAVAAMVQLTRGNGIVLVPALLLTAVISHRIFAQGSTRRALWICAIIVSLGIPAVVWNVRNSQRSYPGIHGSSYFDELRAKQPMELWKRASSDAGVVERASLHDFGVRLYRNVAWGQIYNYPRAAAHPVTFAVAAADSTKTALLAILPLWCLLVLGVALLYRRCPMAVWFLGLTMIVILVWPWPWGGDIRFIAPVLPVLTLSFYLGLQKVAGRHCAAILTMGFVVVNLAQSVDAAITQRRSPYASPEFGNVLQLVERAGSELRRDELLVLDPSIAGLGLVIAGRAAVDVDRALADMRTGTNCSALAVVSVLTPSTAHRLDAWRTEESWGAVSSDVLHAAGSSQLIRVGLAEHHDVRCGRSNLSRTKS